MTLTGPGHTRQLSLDVGLPVPDGGPRPVPPVLAQLWAASRTVVRFFHDDGEQPEFDVADDLPLATTRTLEELRTKAPFRPTPGPAASELRY